MRITRLKRIQRSLSFYVNNFGFRKPYQVLIDGTLCYVALEDKLDIVHQLTSYLGDNIKFLTTPCVVLETEKLGSTLYGAMLILKKFPVVKCGHDKPLPGSECLLSIIRSSNSHRFIIATQDRELQNIVRSIPAVPLMYFHKKAPTFEQPSKADQQAAEALSSKGISKYEKERLAKLAEEEIGINLNPPSRPKRKKSIRGPNPLSCKKKIKCKLPSVNKQSKEADGGIVKKKNRRGKKIPKHVKEELRQSKSM